MELIKRFIEDKDPFMEMAVRVGVTDDSYLIYVNTDDGGKIPHFHYVDENSRGKNRKTGFNSCVKIESAEYFCHGKYCDRLNTKQRKELQEFLSSPFEKPRFHGTNWDYIVMLWNMNNSDVEVSEDMNMPDYRNLR